ncbi:MAG: hypothetical protein PUF03_12040 [Lachnospiraceae bacterium]|nr:hypothetical protein [Lachnospiraceae bacterium]
MEKIKKDSAKDIDDICISEMLTELSECREDERCTQNQIFTIISTSGTVLSILFGSSFVGQDINKHIIDVPSTIAENSECMRIFINILHEYATFSRVLFLLSAVVFCTAFAYIIVLGINNVLRYFYIQNLEDRLCKFISYSGENNEFLHWNAYSAPVITKNIKHITSSYTALSYAVYLIATGCAILFSMGMVIFLFLIIYPKRMFDYMVIILISLFMSATFCLFIRLSSKADDMSKFAWKTAYENRKFRLSREKEKIYGNTENFRHTLQYLFYPKLQDLQKPMLIILGFIYGYFITNVDVTLDNIVTYVLRIILVLFVFDFLAYQARYQINDIRGIEEDMEAGGKVRLTVEGTQQSGHLMMLSGKVAFCRIIFALLITIVCGGEVKRLLLTCLCILLISTILYELVRKKEIIWSIFVTVGIGYPLRFFLGFFTIAPIEWISLQPFQLVCFSLAICAYGSFASTLSWANEVINRMNKERNASGKFPSEYKKKHYMYIQKIFEKRFENCEGRNRDIPIMPLHEKSELKDPWNLALILSLIFIFIVALLKSISVVLLVIEIIVVLLFVISIYLSNRKKMVLMCIAWICIVGKGIIAISCYNGFGWYVLLSIMQLIITGTYFILCYQPQRKYSITGIFSNLIQACIKIIYGDKAYKIWLEEKK